MNRVREEKSVEQVNAEHEDGTESTEKKDVCERLKQLIEGASQMKLGWE